VVVVTAQRILEGIYRAATLVCLQRRHRTPLRGTTADGTSKQWSVDQRQCSVTLYTILENAGLSMI
jgi:hypothetical protein